MNNEDHRRSILSEPEFKIDQQTSLTYSNIYANIKTLKQWHF